MTNRRRKEFSEEKCRCSVHSYPPLKIINRDLLLSHPIPVERGVWKSTLRAWQGSWKIKEYKIWQDKLWLGHHAPPLMYYCCLMSTCSLYCLISLFKILIISLSYFIIFDNGSQVFFSLLNGFFSSIYLSCYFLDCP